MTNSNKRKIKMENKELNLCEILKDCPKGTKLYTPLYGVCSLYSVDDKFVTVDYVGTVNVICYETFFPNGAISELGDECLLFPSKDNRDWSTFKPKKERFDPKTLKPFDKVLARDENNTNWIASLFSSIEEFGLACINGFWKQCIPYNDETAHLVGTTGNAPEYYKWWEE